MLRARWIDSYGHVVRDDRFEAHPERHESYRYTNDLARITLAVDNRYFKASDEGAKRDRLHEHLDGYIEIVTVTPAVFLIVNDEGRLRDGWRPNNHPAVRMCGAIRGDLIFGPVVLVERVEP